MYDTEWGPDSGETNKPRSMFSHGSWSGGRENGQRSLGCLSDQRPRERLEEVRAQDGGLCGEECGRDRKGREAGRGIE